MRPSKWSPRAIGWSAGPVAVAGTGALVWWSLSGSPDLDFKTWEVVPNLLLTVALAVAWLVVPIVLGAHRVAAALRFGGRRERARTALLAGVARPVWQLPLAVLLLTAGSTFLARRVYLTAAARSWGDAFLWVSLAVLAVAGVQLLVLGVAGVVAGSRRSFHGGMVAGALTLVAFTAGYLAAYLPGRFAYRADPGLYPSDWNLGQGDLLVPFDLLFASLLLALPWPVLGAAIGARSSPDAGGTGGTGCSRLRPPVCAMLTVPGPPRCVPSSRTSTSAENGVASLSAAPRPRCGSGRTP